MTTGGTNAHLADKCGLCGREIQLGTGNTPAEPRTFMTTKSGTLMLVHTLCKDKKEIEEETQRVARGPRVGGVYKGSVATAENTPAPGSTGVYTHPKAEEVVNINADQPSTLQSQGELGVEVSSAEAVNTEALKAMGVSTEDLGTMPTQVSEVIADPNFRSLTDRMMELKSAAETIFETKVKVKHRQAQSNMFEIELLQGVIEV